MTFVNSLVFVGLLILPPGEVGSHSDRGGNLLFDGEQRFCYDPWNRLVAIHEPGTLDVDTTGLPFTLTGTMGDCIAEFEYDALGRRVRTTSWPGSTRQKITEHVYGSGPAVLEEYDIEIEGGEETATLERWFIHGESFPDPQVMYDLTDEGYAPAGVEEPFYYLKDALGSIGALVRADGTVVERYDYDPYGRTTVLDADGQPLPTNPGGPEGQIYYHDHDLNGIIDVSDLGHLAVCANPQLDDDGAVCVFIHDRNGDQLVDAVDIGIFLEFTEFDPEGPGLPAPEIFRKPATQVFDLDGNWRIDLFDYYGLAQCYLSTNGLCLAVYDEDADGQVTVEDFETFAEALDGPGILPWGLDRTASRFGNPFMWTGQRYDSDTGMYHFLARSYKPALGRFFQRDPIGGQNATGIVYFHPLSLAPLLDEPCKDCTSEYDNGMNVYAGIASNPVNFIDPFGRDWLDDEGINTDAHTWGFGTSVIAMASGQIFSIANIWQGVMNGFLAATNWVDNLNDCVRRYDPAELLLEGSGVALKSIGIAGAQWPKRWRPFPVDHIGPDQKEVYAVMHRVTNWLSRKGLFGKGVKTALGTGIRAATRVNVYYGVALAGVEAYCAGRQTVDWAASKFGW